MYQTSGLTDDPVTAAPMSIPTTPAATMISPIGAVCSPSDGCRVYRDVVNIGLPSQRTTYADLLTVVENDNSPSKERALEARVETADGDRCRGDLCLHSGRAHHTHRTDAASGRKPGSRVDQVMHRPTSPPPVPTIGARCRDRPRVEPQQRGIAVQVVWIFDADDPAISFRRRSPNAKITAGRNSSTLPTSHPGKQVDVESLDDPTQIELGAGGQADAPVLRIEADPGDSRCASRRELPPVVVDVFE